MDFGKMHNIYIQNDNNEKIPVIDNDGTEFEITGYDLFFRNIKLLALGQIDINKFNDIVNYATRQQITSKNGKYSKFDCMPLSHEDINNLLQTGDGNIVDAVLAHPACNKEIRDNFLFQVLQNAILEEKNKNNKELHTQLSTPFISSFEKYFSDINFNEEQLDKFSKNNNRYMKYIVLHPNTGKKTIDRLLKMYQKADPAKLSQWFVYCKNVSDRDRAKIFQKLSEDQKRNVVGVLAYKYGADKVYQMSHKLSKDERKFVEDNINNEWIKAYIKNEYNAFLVNQYWIESGTLIDSYSDEMDIQGWKMHISCSTPEEYSVAVNKLCRALYDNGAIFKIVNPDMFQEQQNTSQKGKTITIYPQIETNKELNEYSDFIVDFSKLPDEVKEFLMEPTAIVPPNDKNILNSKISIRYGLQVSHTGIVHGYDKNGNVITNNDDKNSKSRQHAYKPDFINEPDLSSLIKGYKELSEIAKTRDAIKRISDYQGSYFIANNDLPPDANISADISADIRSEPPREPCI